MKENNTERSAGGLYLKTGAIVIFVLLASLGGGAYAASVLGGTLFLVLAAAVFSLCILLSKTYFIYLALPLSYGAAILFGASPIEAVFALTFAPAAIALAAVIKRRGKALYALIAMSILFGLCFAASYAYMFYDAYGSVFGGAAQFYEEYRELLVSQLASIEITAPDGVVTHPYTEEMIVTSLSAVVINLPGVISVTLAFLSSIVILIARFLLRKLKADSLIPDGFGIVLPRSWGVMFFVFGIASAILPASGIYGMYRAAATNLFMISLGTLAAYGASIIVGNIRRSSLVSTSKLVMFFISFFLIAFLGVFVIAGASFYGALCAIFPRKKSTANPPANRL